MSACVIVKRNNDLQDVGVWTGGGQLIRTTRMLADNLPLIQILAETSTDIADAFVFSSEWQAYRWKEFLDIEWDGQSISPQRDGMFVRPETFI